MYVYIAFSGQLQMSTNNFIYSEKYLVSLGFVMIRHNLWFMTQLLEKQMT